MSEMESESESESESDSESGSRNSCDVFIRNLGVFIFGLEISCVCILSSLITISDHGEEGCEAARQ